MFVAGSTIMVTQQILPATELLGELTPALSSELKENRGG